MGLAAAVGVKQVGNGCEWQPCLVNKAPGETRTAASRREEWQCVRGTEAGIGTDLGIRVDGCRVGIWLRRAPHAGQYRSGGNTCRARNLSFAYERPGCGKLGRFRPVTGEGALGLT